MKHGNVGLRFAAATVAITTGLVMTHTLARADAVTNWNRTAGDIIVGSGLGPLPADRALAILHGAVYEAVNAITGRYPASGSGLIASPGASVDAAIAAASRTTLAELAPHRKDAVEAAYQSALAAIENSPAKSKGISVGSEAAKMVLAMRADDGARRSAAHAFSTASHARRDSPRSPARAEDRTDSACPGHRRYGFGWGNAYQGRRCLSALDRVMVAGTF